MNAHEIWSGNAVLTDKGDFVGENSVSEDLEWEEEKTTPHQRERPKPGRRAVHENSA